MLVTFSVMPLNGGNYAFVAHNSSEPLTLEEIAKIISDNPAIITQAVPATNGLTTEHHVSVDQLGDHPE